MNENIRKSCESMMDTLRCYSATWLRRAAARYEATGEEPYVPVRISNTAKAMWKLMKALIDEDKKSRKNSPKRNEPPYSTPVFNTGCEKKERKNERKELSPTPPIEKKEIKKEKNSLLPAHACVRTGEGETKTPQPDMHNREQAPHPATEARASMVHGYYNQIAGVAGLLPLPPLSRRLTDNMTAVLRGYSDKEIARAIERASRSDTLCGRRKHGFRADFFWIFETKHYTRIESGFYDNKETVDTDREAIRLLADKYRDEQLGTGCEAEVDQTLW